jgi:hypothetical protein
MRERIVGLIEQKLSQALRDVDGRVESEVRSAWQGIGPGPSCPSVHSVMQSMQRVVAEGCRERGQVAKDTVVSTLAPIRGELDDKLVVQLNTAARWLPCTRHAHARRV